MKKGKTTKTTEKDHRFELMKTALGTAKADLVIRDGDILNVYTGEILKKWSISIRKKHIAYVGEDPDHTIGANTRIIDASGKTVIPGLIDGHAHLAWFFNATEFLKSAMRGGTTTIITETMEPYPVSGVEGVMDFLNSISEQPIKIFATAPAMGSISKNVKGIPLSEAKKLMSHPAVLGVGEAYWQGVLQDPESILPVLEETLRLNKILEGHSAGARGKKLTAYAALGFSSCHEPITAEEVLERLRLGIWVMIREGSIRRDLGVISAIKDRGVNLRRLILVTDGITPKDLMEKGYMEFVVQKAINCGFDPVSAVQMATLNVAEHFSMDHLIGGIAPGRFADLLVIPDLRNISPECVISNGEILYKDGSLLNPPRNHRFLAKHLNSIHLNKCLDATDFKIKSNRKGKKVMIRVIRQATDLVTQEDQELLEIVNGEIKGDPNREILKVAAIDRTHFPGKMFVGFVKGFGMKQGAFASSAAWDTSDIIVVGADDSDMALAVNRIAELQGGAVLCKSGRILSELSLPIFGLMSNLPLDRLQKEIESLNTAAGQLGIPFPDPLLTLITLTGAAIPFLRICEEGLFNLKDGERKDLVVSVAVT